MVGSNPWNQYETGETEAGHRRYARHGGDSRLIIQIPHDLDWQARAACRDSDFDFSGPLRGPETPTIREMRAVCASCQVQDECLASLLETVDDYNVTQANMVPGMWAGMRGGELWAGPITEWRAIRRGKAAAA
jgi:hypothetical protein